MAEALHRSLLPQVVLDLQLLGQEDDGLVDAALQAISDLADQRPERFRVVYRLLPDERSADTVEIISVGRRGGHAVYLAAVARMGEPDE